MSDVSSPFTLPTSSDFGNGKPDTDSTTEPGRSTQISLTAAITSPESPVWLAEQIHCRRRSDQIVTRRPGTVAKSAPSIPARRTAAGVRFI